MEKFWIVTLFHLHLPPEELAKIEAFAIDDCGSQGIEEFVMNEAEVDAILGERSYSGGDLPQEVLDEVEEKVLSKPGNFRFFFEEESRAQKFLQEAKTSLLCESQLEEGVVQDRNAEWKKHYAPILVNSELEVIPAWMKSHPSLSKHQIYINPGMGFGTGSHETTFLCLKLFTEIAGAASVKNVLDFGSGSGILGLSVFKFFPEARVDFYDIDLEANKNCYENAHLNGLSERAFRLLLPDYRESLQAQYDIVFANILESILMVEKKALIDYTSSNGSLILSGLLRHQVPGIIQSYTESGMELVKLEEKGDWAALLMKKRAL